MTYSERDMMILEAIQSGYDAGRRIYEARKRGASPEEMARLQEDAFGMQVTFDDDSDFVPAVIKGGKNG